MKSFEEWRMMAERGVDPERLALWQAYLHGNTAVLRALERDLQQQLGISLAQYDVLQHLHDAPACRLRLGELADAVLFSTGGLTRLLDRLERAGLVTRARTPEDRRGVYAVLTDAGADCYSTARATHLRGVWDYFAAHLRDEELQPVAAFMARLVEAADERQDRPEANAAG